MINNNNTKNTKDTEIKINRTHKKRQWKTQKRKNYLKYTNVILNS